MSITLEAYCKQIVAEPSELPKIKAGLDRYAKIITGVVFAIIAVALAAVLACGIVHPAVIVGLGLATILSGVMLSLALRDYLRPPIPQEFLKIIKTYYPKAIYDLCVRQKLTIQELRTVLTGVSEHDLSSVPDSLKVKLEKFGKERLIQECEDFAQKSIDSSLPKLDDLLVRFCPWYFLKRFVDLGPKEMPQAENLPPEVYWTGPMGRTSGFLESVFAPHTWLFGRVVSEGEYHELLDNAKNGTWDCCKDLVESIHKRMLGDIGFSYLKDSAADFKVSQWTSSVSTYRSLLLCKHGMSWEQLQLISDISNEELWFLHLTDTLSRSKMGLVRHLLSVFPHIQEDSSAYDPDVALVTWDTWISQFRKFLSHQDVYQSNLEFLASRSRNSNLVFDDWFLGMGDALTSTSYRYDVNTGKKRDV
ncbi:DUF1389 domain-containing protein [Chlamydia vaughanii]|uniref:DUF1389 domain-containing protein n=1 Tax=Chlamydia vaughanii TaxID=3112552 RepID=UPI0032B2289B